MSSHNTSQLPAQGALTPAPNPGGNPGPWRYSAMLRVVSHDSHACSTCSAWKTHYTKSAMDDEPTLFAAEAQRAEVLRTALTAENLSLQQSNASLQRNNGVLQQNNDSLKDATASLNRELDAIRSDLARTREDLDDTRRRLRSADDEIIRSRDSKDDLERDADRVISDLKDEVASLKDRLHDLDRGNTPRRRKMPRHDSRSPSHSHSRHASSRASCRTPSRDSRAPSPMVEDRDDVPSRTVADPPQLLSRLAVPSTTTSSTTSLPLGEPPQPSPVAPSPSAGVDLASRLTDAVDLAPPDDASPFIESVGFCALLPVLSHCGRQYECSALTPSGDIDYSSSHFIYADGGATGGLTDRGPSWTTTLVPREYLLLENPTKAIQLGLPLPLDKLIVGGRNGVLISQFDPTTEEGITELLTTPRKRNRAAGYIDRV